MGRADAQHSILGPSRVTGIHRGFPLATLAGRKMDGPTRWATRLSPRGLVMGALRPRIAAHLTCGVPDLHPRDAAPHGPQARARGSLGPVSQALGPRPPKALLD